MQLSGGVSIGRDANEQLRPDQQPELRVQRRRSRERTPPIATSIRRSSRNGRRTRPTRCRCGIQVSANFQSLSGPELSASYPLTNAIALPSLGRNFTNAAPTVALVPPCTMYGDRIYQTDLRFNKTIKSGPDDDPPDDLDLQPVQREPDPDLHHDLRRRVAGADGHPQPAIHGLRRADRLLTRGSHCRGHERPSPAIRRADLKVCTTTTGVASGDCRSAGLQACRDRSTQSKYQKLCSSTTFPFEKQRPLARKAW